MDLVRIPGVKRKRKKKEREKQIPTPMTSAMLICVNFLDVLSSNSGLFISPIHIQTSSFRNFVYSKIIVYQGRKVSKSLWIFLCVKSLWSQDRRGVMPTWFCASSGHSLRKFSSLNVNLSLPWWGWRNCCCFRPWWILISYQLWHRASTQSPQSLGPESLR